MQLCIGGMAPSLWLAETSAFAYGCTVVYHTNRTQRLFTAHTTLRTLLRIYFNPTHCCTQIPRCCASISAFFTRVPIGIRVACIVRILLEAAAAAATARAATARAAAGKAVRGVRTDLPKRMEGAPRCDPWTRTAPCYAGGLGLAPLPAPEGKTRGV